MVLLQCLFSKNSPKLSLQRERKFQDYEKCVSKFTREKNTRQNRQGQKQRRSRGSTESRGGGLHNTYVCTYKYLHVKQALGPTLFTKIPLTPEQWMRGPEAPKNTKHPFAGKKKKKKSILFYLYVHTKSGSPTPPIYLPPICCPICRPLCPDRHHHICRNKPPPPIPCETHTQHTRIHTHTYTTPCIRTHIKHFSRLQVP